MFLLNGEHRHCVDVSDRGFQYGDGLFETVEVLQGKPLFFDRHLKRLAEGCRRLLIPMPDSALFEAEARQLSESSDRAVLKLMVTRGSGGRGYRQPDQIIPTRLFSLHPYPDYPQHFQVDGIAARFCDQRLSLNPSLAGIKHMNRLEQILARAEWQDDSIQEGLMLDTQDRVVEGTMSNLFIVKSGNLYTPSLGQCGVAGIVRELIMEFAQRIKLPLFEQPVDQAAVLQADELFVSNSVIGIWPIKRLEARVFKVGVITRRLQDLLNTARMAEV
ncbi:MULTISPECIES: aminodeoxychorismate lyase [Methylomonas]|uniref:Aminodeoxychorismate lyase n=2 Tax=Methylomonas TaxID=416 RepID=A0A126T6X7_9GAMM|nr:MULTISPECIES: aminodeoxychorismate lyase [Methylomonas]AMK77843.1 4-amino-4-deoxychorismate lyase [Methylomonas denitrificans]OAI00933.1 aminodeoxychorismate lyase [Methylomonas methanica]TCV87014.1 aminodeoxychorismate lyase apoprotein [Methylomonas methanica]